MKKRVLCVVGSRPQLLKVSREWADVVIDTGQHWDPEMTQGFKPDYNLKTTELGKMIERLEPLITKEKPSHIVVIGDTRSTYAGAIVARYKGIPLIHIEAGMRSYENIVEERIRHMVDHVAQYCLVTNEQCADNLAKEGLTAVLVGDVEFDVLFEMMPFGKKIGEREDGALLYEYKPDWKNKEKTPYNLLTLHRAELVDDKSKLNKVFKALEKSKQRFIFPVHPRTLKQLKKFKLKLPKNIEAIKPQPHKELVRLIVHSEKVVTDSGGVQREASWLLKPVVIIRETTEHADLIKNSQAALTGFDEKNILWALSSFRRAPMGIDQTGQAHERIAQFLKSL